MVDIHSHILPEMDDGSKSVEMSIEMLELAAASGTTDIVASPHSDLQFSFQPELIEQRIAELNERMAGRIRIYPGCDFHLYFDNIQDCLNHPRKYTINYQSYLLVEFPDTMIAPTTGEIFDRLGAAGINPIITHPERNPLLFRKMDQLVQWVRSGALIQITAGSFLGKFGKQALNASSEMMERGIVHFIASDAHDPEYRPPILKEAYDYIADRYDAERAELLFKINPQATLTGGYVDNFEVVTIKQRKWYQFW